MGSRRTLNLSQICILLAIMFFCQLFVNVFILTFVNGEGDFDEDNFTVPAKLTIEHEVLYPFDSSKTSKHIWAPLRIIPFYIPSSSHLTSTEQWDIVKNVTEWTFNEITKVTYAVRRLKDPILLSRFCLKNGTTTDHYTYCRKSEGHTCDSTPHCGIVPVPPDHVGGCYVMDENNKTEFTSGSGIKNADLVIYVTVSNNCSGSTIARADACAVEEEFERPIVGRIILCNRFFSGNKQKTTLQHELLHIMLGLTLNGTAYRDEYGRRRNNTVIVIKDQLGGGTRVVSTLPSVVNFVRNHFVCSTLEGAELVRSAERFIYGHVSGTIFPGALLTPQIFGQSHLSRLEMAFLNDTGWYRVNHSYEAVELLETQNKTCKFTTFPACYKNLEHRQTLAVSVYPKCELPVKTCPTEHSQLVACVAEKINEIISQDCVLTSIVSSFCFSVHNYDTDKLPGICIKLIFDNPRHRVNASDQSCKKFDCKKEMLSDPILNYFVGCNVGPVDLPLSYAEVLCATNYLPEYCLVKNSQNSVSTSAELDATTYFLTELILLLCYFGYVQYIA